eukprot:Pompholyxophrys_punicea_v1_NODE_467_length_1895_cov_15.628804.p1 type:complete len:113 gc:universal NODE_467_length_1895_cov_15.628804:614-276(-)
MWFGCSAGTLHSVTVASLHGQTFVVDFGSVDPCDLLFYQPPDSSLSLAQIISSRTIKKIIFDPRYESWILRNSYEVFDFFFFCVTKLCLRGCKIFYLFSYNFIRLNFFAVNN